MQYCSLKIIFSLGIYEIVFWRFKKTSDKEEVKFISQIFTIFPTLYRHPINTAKLLIKNICKIPMAMLQIAIK